MTLTYASVCSGIEAVSVAWHDLPMRPLFFAETDKFCSAVLAHHWPEIPNLGDFTKIGPEHGPVDVLVGGTPCQSFSPAGGRAGLRDSRGILALEFLLLAARLQAKWLVFENVPGLLFSGDGGDPEEDEAADGERVPEPGRRTFLDFGTFLGALGQLGFGFAYRILDAQHCGVPQRRRRVFVVGRSGGDWRAAAAVLFERESLRGTYPPRRATGTDAAGEPQASLDDGDRAGDTAFSLATKSVFNVQPISASIEPNTLVAKPTEVAEALTSMGPQRRCDRGDLVVVQEPISFDPAQITHAENRSKCEPGQAAPTLAATGRPHVAHRSFVRRLVPLEYERLQGFPDDFTRIDWRGKPAPDGRRYKAVGNSMAVPVMRWLGERILLVEEVLGERDGRA